MQLHQWAQELRYSARHLRRSPGFTLVAALSLALGICVNTAVFTVVNAVLLKPLPVAEPETIVTLFTSDYGGSPYGGSSYPDYLDFRDQAEVLDLVAYWGQTVRFSSATGQAEEDVNAEIVSGNYFRTLGVTPVSGRAFLPEEASVLGDHAIAVLSHGLWARRFGSDPALVGKQVLLNKLSYTVVGIAPPGFNGLVRGVQCDVWLPMSVSASILNADAVLRARSARSMSLIGRLKPGVTLEQAQARFSLLAQQQHASYPQEWSDANGRTRRITVLPESHSRIPPQARGAVVIVSGLVFAVFGMVLAVGCANLAGMLLARAATRRREIAVRAAIGATRPQLIRLMLSESLILAGLGCAMGLLGTWWLGRWATLVLPAGLDLAPDLLVMAFAAALSLLAGLLLGLAPALQVTRPDPYALKEEGATSTGRRSRLRRGLVAAQVAVSTFLLLGAGLALRSLWNLNQVDPGFDRENLLLVEMTLEEHNQTTGREFYGRLVESASRIQGVRAASAVNRPGLDFDGTRRTVHVPADQPEQGRTADVSFNLVGPGYFHTMRIPLLAGRDFTARDSAGAPGVVIINETMARQFFPGQNAVGKHISFGGQRGSFLEVVGVVRDGKYRSLSEETQPFFSLPILQEYEGHASLVLRTAGDPQLAIPFVRQAIGSLDPTVRMGGFTTMSEYVGAALLPWRIASLASAALGLLALFLSCLGLYGMLSYFVDARRREIGIRMALGAMRADIIRLIVSQGLRPTILGVAMGAVSGLGLMRLLEGLLYGVEAHDPATLLVVTLILSAVAWITCWLPARRATKVDPMVALRYE